MKFLVTKDLGHSKLLSVLIGTVVFAILLSLILDVFVHGYILGWDIESISTTLYGNVDTFEEPILLDSLLLQVHIDFFMAIFSLLILSSVWIRLYSNYLYMRALLHIVLLSALLAPIFLILAYIGSSYFLYVWIFTFFLWHILALILSFMILKKLSF